MMSLDDILAITLWEPWASFMVAPPPFRCKAIETRHWAPRAGVTRLLICSAARTTHRVDPGVIGHYEIIRAGRGRQAEDSIHDLETGARRQIVYGAALGIVTLDATLPMVPRVTSRGVAPHEGEHRIFVDFDNPQGSVITGKPETLLRTNPGGGSPLDISAEAPYGDYAPGRWGWSTSHPRDLIVPVPVKGAQQLWRPTPNLLAKVRAQLR